MIYFVLVIIHPQMLWQIFGIMFLQLSLTVLLQIPKHIQRYLYYQNTLKVFVGDVKYFINCLLFIVTTWTTFHIVMIVPDIFPQNIACEWSLGENAQLQHRHRPLSIFLGIQFDIGLERQKMINRIPINQRMLCCVVSLFNMPFSRSDRLMM